MNKYSIILGNLGNTCDRFLSSGYKDQPSKETMIRQASQIDGVKAVELVGTWDVKPENVDQIGDYLHKYGLGCSAIIPDHFSQKRWGKGAFTAKDPAIRAQALEETLLAAQMARTLHCPLLNLWPGQDGYDYIFQADYQEARGWLVDAIKTAAKAYPDIYFSLEYKSREPRTHSFMARSADTLLIAQGTGLPNVGVTIDTGHALAAGENMAEAAVLLSQPDSRLFHMHFNDNYRSWDDDMIVGSVHCAEYIELLYWLKKTGYNSWYSMDQYPYREDGQEALRGSVEFLQAIEAMLDSVAMDELGAIIARGQAVESTAWIRAKLFGERGKTRAQ